MEVWVTTQGYSSMAVFRFEPRLLKPGESILITWLNCYLTFIPNPEPFLLKSICLDILIKRSILATRRENLTLNIKFINAKKIVKWNNFHSQDLFRGNLRDNAYVLVDSVETVHIHLIFSLGEDKKLVRFHDLLREGKRGNKGVNQKTSDIKGLFTPCESFTLFCFKNMLGIHLIFFRAHPLPCKPSIVHG